MPSSSTPPGRSVARITLQLVLPSQPDHVAGTRKLVISELNSPPVLPSVNASATALLQLPHDSRMVWFVLDLHHKTLSFSILYRF